MMSIRRIHGSFFGVVIMGLMLAACDQQGPSPGPIGSILPTGTASVVAQMPERQTPETTPISPVASQVIEGIKVSVQPVAFDAHRVIVAYSLEGPAQPYRYGLSASNYIYDPDNRPVLSLGGKGLPLIYDRGIYNELYLDGGVPAAGKPVRVQGKLYFDASKLDGSTAIQELPMRLSLPISINNELYGPPVPVPTGMVIAPTKTPTVAHAASRTLMADMSFSVPFDTRHIVVQTNQTVVSLSLIHI